MKNTKTQKKKIKGWVVLIKRKFWMYDTKLENRLWARITRTKRQAKNLYPDGKIIKCEITYNIPKK